MNDSHLDPRRRHEFVLFFDVSNGNPNGDPDAGNLPRLDPETNHGLVTDVAIKRKIRDYVTMTRGQKDGFAVFIQTEDALNTLIEQAFDDEGIDKEEHNKKTADASARVRMCKDYFDIRMFGAVLSTGDLNAGQVRGPIQVGFSRSIDPILSLDLSITRQARTTEERMETGTTEMGRKPIVPYALYRAHGFYNPYLGSEEGGTGIDRKDLEILWEALEQMFEFDRSAARGEMATRGLYVFSHENMKGNARASELFDLVDVQLHEKIETPREFGHYEINLQDPPMEGVELNRLVG